MKSRFFTGGAVLGLVAVTLAGAAAAQRMGRFRQIMQAEQQQRGNLPAPGTTFLAVGEDDMAIDYGPFHKVRE